MLEFRKDILDKIKKREEEKKKQMPVSGGDQEFEIDKEGRLVPIVTKSEKQKILEAEFNEEWKEIEEKHEKVQKERKEAKEKPNKEK